MGIESLRRTSRSPSGSGIAKSVLAVLIVIVAGGAGPPTYQGRSVDVWLKALNGDDVIARRSAAWAMSRFGPRASKAATRLMNLLKSDDELLKWAVARALGEIGATIPPAEYPSSVFRSRYSSRSSRRRAAALRMRNAARAGNGLGRATAGVVSALTTALSDSSMRVRRQAVMSLGKIGLAARSAVPALTELVRGTESPLRMDAVVALGQIGPAATTAVTPLRETLRDTDRHHLMLANVMTFSGIGPGAAPAVPDLLAVLTTERSVVLRAAVGWALERIGSADLLHYRDWLAQLKGTGGRAATLPTWIRPVLVMRIVESYTRSDSANRGVADDLLRRYADTLIPDIVGLLGHSNPNVQKAAETTLLSTGTVVLRVLTTSLDNAKEPLRSRLIEVVGKLLSGGNLGDHEELIGLLGNKSDIVREAAVRGLAKTGAAVVPLLIGALEAEDPRVVVGALTALGQMSMRSSRRRRSSRSAAEPAISAILDHLNNPNTEVREQAFKTLVQIGLAVIQSAKRLLIDPKSTDKTRTTAARILAALGTYGIRELSRSLKDRNSKVRVAAVKGFANAGPQAAAAVGTLLVFAADRTRSAKERSVALDVIRAIGSPAVPTLVKGLTARTVKVRRYAATALGNLGADARGSLSALRRALKDRDSSVRRAASSAIRKIEK